VKLNFDKEHLLMTDMSRPGFPQKTAPERAKELLSVLQDIKTQYGNQRQTQTNRMLECWASYLGTPESQDYLRANAINKTVGDVQKDWRHRVNNGKGYEIVETVVGYLMAATFPNLDWFDMIPETPMPEEVDYLKFIRIMKAFLSSKLDASHFRDRYECFLRQMVVTGTSVISLPWRLETKEIKRNIKVKAHGKDSIKQQVVEKCIYNAPDIVVEDMVDIFLDPEGTDPNTASLLRRMTKTKAEVLRLVEEDIYDLATRDDIIRCSASYRVKSPERQTYEHLLGAGDSGDWHMGDKVEVWEFWGTVQLSDMEIQDVVVTFVDSTLLRCETNPYWGGKPFIVGTYTPVVNSPYGMGALEPILGLLHTMNIIDNNRLDAVELAVNPMWIAVNDGTLDLNDVYSEPGRIIPVGDLGSLQPLVQDNQFQGVSITEASSLETKIDKACGTGAFVGSGAGRSGERVTATEVQAVRDAGGNRLSNIHAHIEDTSLMPFLQRAYVYAQQFVVEPEVVAARGNTADEWWYARVGLDQLSYDFKIKARGAQHVADREFELRMRTEWIATITAVPEMAQLVDWAEVAKDITSRFTGEEASRFIMDEPAAPPTDPNAQPEPPMPTDPNQMKIAGAQQVGGTEMGRAVEQDVMAQQQFADQQAAEQGLI
jgi:hypothetical protein